MRGDERSQKDEEGWRDRIMEGGGGGSNAHHRNMLLSAYQDHGGGREEGTHALGL